MKTTNDISRRNTLKRIAGALLLATGARDLGKNWFGHPAFGRDAVPPDTLVDPDSVLATPPSDLGACDATSIKTTVSKDPKHELVIPREDVLIGETKSYGIQGRSGHNHVVTLTSVHFEALKSGQMVQVKSSSTLLHAHTCEIKCASE